MSKKEIGEITEVVKQNEIAEYKVKLSSGETLFFSHALLYSSQMTLLTRGTRLMVEHEGGQVLSVSTNINQTKKGVVREIKRHKSSVVYSVEFEQDTSTIEIPREEIQLHPKERILLRGAILDIQIESGALRGARLVMEKDIAKITNVNIEQRTVSIKCKQSGGYTVRLAPEEIRQVIVGEDVDLEIEYTAEGKRKLKLQRRKIETDQKIDESSDQREKSQYKKNATQPPIDPVSQSPDQSREQELPVRIEADVLGLDPAILEQVKMDGHRYEIVSFLEKHAEDGLIGWYTLKPGQQARYMQPIKPLDSHVLNSIRGAIGKFQGFFQHQALALDAIRSGHNLVIVTQTASGKTLSYNPAVFEYLLKNPQGHVLYVFPLNALMMDQLEKINNMIVALEKEGVKVSASRMMGGMTIEERDATAQYCPNIVVTNPEMLNYLLDRADGVWLGFFSDLKIIIIDEVHTYRGIFGVHMTGIIRRLLITARRLGSDPRFVISSATVSNPLDLASRLTSLPRSEFVLLNTEQDGSGQADKHWLVLNPDWGSQEGKYKNYQEVAAYVFVEMLLSHDAEGNSSPLNTILFCRSMREVNQIKKLVDQRLNQKAPDLKSKVRSYISANLTIDVKHQIYNGLRSGDLWGVISTNALEAGIDIGKLDACIIAGFPFSVMRLRQMAGRVGRQGEGIVFFIPHPLSSLDQYYSDHPNLLLEQAPEEFVVDPQNPYIARKHINAAAYPVGLSESDLFYYWGVQADGIVLQAQKDRVMTKRGDRWMGSKRNYHDQKDPYQIANIRSNTQIPYLICKENPNCVLRAECFDQNRRPCESRVTLLDQQYIYRDCHPRAVYESPDQGIFRILSIDDIRRVVKVNPLPDDCLDRTYVEADIEIELNGPPRANKLIIPGVEMSWGSATVTRLYTGYYEYTLIPMRRCRRCRKEYDEIIDSCPTCHRPTERFYNQSRPERKDFPIPYQQGFRIILSTIACWLTIDPKIEASLLPSSPCKLPGDQNRVLAWLHHPLDLIKLTTKLQITDEEKRLIIDYYSQASESISRVQRTPKETLLFPGIYGQCLLSIFRQHVKESRALELFQAITGYPVTNELLHICRDCRRSVLSPAMHTLEHVVDARYPSVALGDPSDIGAFTTLGHPATGLPTIFWFDNYEGGLGAAEKIYELIPRLLEAGMCTVDSCSCTTVEGCPRCTYIPDCNEGNDNLSKPAGVLLLSKLMGRELIQKFNPFIYSKKRATEFDRVYQANETTASSQGIDEEAPIPNIPLDPYQVLRIQRLVHKPVVGKAFEVRSHEIIDETPTISAEQLNQAYQTVINATTLIDWQALTGNSPYEILEVLPSASPKMIQKIFRLIAQNIHPDRNPDRTDWANDRMKALNAAYDTIMAEKNGRRR